MFFRLRKTEKQLGQKLFANHGNRSRCHRLTENAVTWNRIQAADGVNPLMYRQRWRILWVVLTTEPAVAARIHPGVHAKKIYRQFIVITKKLKTDFNLLSVFPGQFLGLLKETVAVLPFGEYHLDPIRFAQSG